MVKRFRSACLGVVITLLLATSLLSNAVAPRAMAASVDAETLMVLADLGLTAADLCLDATGSGDPMAMGDCLLCHLGAAVILPVPADSLRDIELRMAAAVLIPAQRHLSGKTHHRAPPARAPPLV